MKAACIETSGFLRSYDRGGMAVGTAAPNCCNVGNIDVVGRSGNIGNVDVLRDCWTLREYQECADPAQAALLPFVGDSGLLLRPPPCRPAGRMTFSVYGRPACGFRWSCGGVA